MARVNWLFKPKVLTIAFEDLGELEELRARITNALTGSDVAWEEVYPGRALLGDLADVLMEGKSVEDY